MAEDEKTTTRKSAPKSDTSSGTQSYEEALEQGYFGEAPEPEEDADE
jgi:hypothetical protein